MTLRDVLTVGWRNTGDHDRPALVVGAITVSLAVTLAALYGADRQAGMLAVAGLTALLALVVFSVSAIPEFLLRNLLIFALFAAVWFPSLGSVGPLNLRLSQVVLPFAVLYLARYRKQDVPAQLPYTLHLGTLFAAFVFWTCLNVILGLLPYPPGQPAAGPLGRVALLALNLVTYGITYFFVRRADDLEDVVKCVSVSGAAMAIVSILVFLALSAGLPLPRQFVGDETGQELMLRDGVLVAEDVVRQFGGPNKATFLAGVTVLSLGMTLSGRRRSRRLYAVCSALAATGVVVGNARGALVGLGTGVLVWLAFLVRREHIVTALRAIVTLGVLAALGFGVAVAVFGLDHPVVVGFISRALQMIDPAAYETGTVGQRRTLWTLLWQDFAVNPLWGHGMDGFRRLYPAHVGVTENFLLEVLHSTALWGFVPLLVALVAAILAAWRSAVQRGTTAPERTMVCGTMACYVCVLVGSLTNSLWAGGLFWMLFGLMVGATGWVNATVRQQPETPGVDMPGPR